MPIVSECPECGAELRFADADEGAQAGCRQCGATIRVGRKQAGFVPESKVKKKKKRPSGPKKPADRLTDTVKKDAVRSGQTGARILLAAFVAHFLAYALIVVSSLSAFFPRLEFTVPTFVPPALGLLSNACLIAAMILWRPTAVAVERGLVVHVGLILGPCLFLVELARAFGYQMDFLSWLATYGRMVYFTLLVVYIERICVLGNRGDLLELTHRVLACGVGVIGIAMIQQFILLVPFFLFGPVMVMLSVGMIILWIVWCVEYFRLLSYAASLER